MFNKPNKILIIEDRVEILEVQEEIFNQQGFEMITAHSGTVGLIKARELRPDLILTDIR